MESYGPVYEIQSSDQELARRFRADPFAPPGPEMMRLLNRLRWQPLAGKHVIVCTKRHQEWVLGRLGAGRGDPVTLLSETVFTNRADAEWAVFKLRWQAATATDIDLGLD